MNETLNMIKSRRSIRSYQSEQISKESLDMILEAGIYAPSANNKQSWYFTVIQQKEMLAYIDENVRAEMAKSDNEWLKSNAANPDYSVFYHAPTLVIVSGRKDNESSIIDCSAATQNMLLAAESLGISSVWLGMIRFFFQSEADISRLEIPEDYHPFYAFALGYKKDQNEIQAPVRDKNVITFIQ